MSKIQALNGFQNASSIDEFWSSLLVLHRFIHKSKQDSDFEEKLSASALTALLHRVNVNYYRFTIPKKSGGSRIIDAPSKELKLVQNIISYALSHFFHVHPSTHGFINKRGIKTNAEVHVGSGFILNIDLKDFFPCVSITRIEKDLEDLGFSTIAARLIGILCTKNNKLPQGSPASPLITNIVSVSLDRRLECFALARGCQYSRYVDDITFSSMNYVFNARFEKTLNKIIENEGFRLNISKTRILTKSDRQEVTGIIVNEKINVNRKFVRKVRAMIHTLSKEGIYEDENKLKPLVMSALGSLYFIRQIRGAEDPLYLRMNNQLISLLQSYG
jgi:RNA-directed DNA polymerase